MNMKELKDLMNVVKNGTVEYELVASMVADIVNFNPNCGDEWYFESVRLPTAKRRLFYKYSSITEYVEVINEVGIEDDGTIYLHSNFYFKHLDEKDSDGNVHNEELEMLRFLDHNHIKVVNIPE